MIKIGEINSFIVLRKSDLGYMLSNKDEQLLLHFNQTNGEELELPTVGVCPFEPIMFEGNGLTTPATASAMIDRIILPRGIIFGFIPEKSGVYKFYSTEEFNDIKGKKAYHNYEMGRLNAYFSGRRGRIYRKSYCS